MQGLSSDLKQVFLVKNNLLTSVHNDADDTDATDDADNTDDYNRVIGIALLKAFSCANNVIKTKWTSCFHQKHFSLSIFTPFTHGYYYILRYWEGR